jgi:putative transposase
MRPVRKTESTAYQIHYHFVTPVKYRKGIFGLPDREHTLVTICKEIEERYEIVFEKIGIDLNHVHYLLSASPKFSPAGIIQIVKSITAREFFRRHSDLKRELWGGHLWTEGYFVATIGEGGNKDVIEVYIAKQGKTSQELQLKLFDF